MEGSQVELRLASEPEAIAHAREALRSTFGARLSEPAYGDLLTVVGELVTNAVRHGPGRPISLKVSLDAAAGVIRGEVVDDGDASKSIPRIRESTERGGGYGLRLVDAMTSEWAVVEGSTSVRFEMPVAG
jgi:anti-sigma regulatory factor (Ser/Thr protein kinase)